VVVLNRISLPSTIQFQTTRRFAGLPAALSVTFNVALRAPVVVGANVTLMVASSRRPPTNSHKFCFEQNLRDRSRSIVTLLIVIAVVPTFFSVTVLTALVVPL